MHKPFCCSKVPYKDYTVAGENIAKGTTHPDWSPQLNSAQCSAWKPWLNYIYPIKFWGFSYCPFLDDFVFRKFCGSKRETTPALPVTWRATLSQIRFFSRSCVSSFLNIMIMTMTRLTMIMMMTWMESATLSPIQLFSKSFARWQGDRDS